VLGDLQNLFDHEQVFNYLTDKLATTKASAQPSPFKRDQSSANKKFKRECSPESKLTQSLNISVDRAPSVDSFYDLPVALQKMEEALQQSNNNCLKLKESLEYVLKRESDLQ